MRRFVCMCLAVILLFSVPVCARGAQLQIDGKSAVLMEAATGTVLYEKNPHQALPPASVTKVMTLLLVMEAIDSGSLSWNDTVTTSEAAAAKGGSQIFLKVGEGMSVADMVKAVAVSSANDCACALAEHIAGSESAFVEKMNEKAKALGMENTHFVNCTGLDDAPEAGEHKTSAYDIAIMSAKLLREHPDIKKYTTIWMDTVRNGTFGLSNTNKLVRFYPGCTGLKTGFTSAAGYCLSASAQRDGMELIAVVMGCETSKTRQAACKTLLDHGFAGYALVTPVAEEGSVAVNLGKMQQVAAVTKGAKPILVEKSQKSSITTQQELLPQVQAPVSQGQRLGTLTVKAGEQVLAQIPLVAEASVPRLTYWEVFLQVLKAFCGGESPGACLLKFEVCGHPGTGVPTM